MISFLPLVLFVIGVVLSEEASQEASSSSSCVATEDKDQYFRDDTNIHVTVCGENGYQRYIKK